MTFIISASPLGFAVKYNTFEPFVPLVRLYSLSRVTPTTANRLNIHPPGFAILISQVVNRALIILPEDIDVYHLFADKNFFGHFRDDHRAIFPEYDDIIDIGAIADKFVFLQTGACKTFNSVYIEFLIGSGYHHGFYGVETPQFGPAIAPFTIFAF
jgi:hypothetical protein